MGTKANARFPDTDRCESVKLTRNVSLGFLPLFITHENRTFDFCPSDNTIYVLLALAGFMNETFFAKYKYMNNHTTNRHVASLALKSEIVFLHFC